MYNKELLERISRKLIATGNTIAVAESVTSGHLQAALSAAPDATTFYEGGITVYNARQKVHHLNIDADDAVKCNCVSEKIAEQMAAHCAKIFMSSVGIGITGYASAIANHETVGLYACFAITLRNKVIDSGIIMSDKKEDSSEVQVFYTEKVLEHLLLNL